MSAVQTFTIIVLDYLEIVVGSTNVQSGQSVTVPITLASSDGVTNLNFNLQWPAGYLSNAILSATAPEIALASLQDQGSKLTLSFQTVAGQVLQATQQIAQLTFTAVSNANSAFVPLPIDSASATKPDGSSYTNYLMPAATIAVIEGEPLLKASLRTNSARELTLYGRLGTSYELQYSTNLSLPTGWGLWMNYVQTNGEMKVGVDSLNPTIFYRIFKP
jgi:hypothetical protein